MGLTIMILGLALFIGVHLFTTMRTQRAALIARLGEGPYKGLYSLIALVGIILIAWGFGLYRAAGPIVVWQPPPWTRHVNNLLLWPAFVCLAAAYIPGDIKRVLKHPLLIGTKLWAIGHLIANGDLGSIVLFTSILLWAGYDRASLKWRSDRGAPDFGDGDRDCDTIAVVVGTLLYIVVGLWLHPYLFGVPAFTFTR